jgi:hypothetical protein
MFQVAEDRPAAHQVAVARAASLSFCHDDDLRSEQMVGDTC